LKFLEELWLLLKNVPTLSHRYKKKSFFAAIFILLWVATTLVKNQLFASASLQAKLLTWTSRVSLALTGLVFVLAFVDLVKDSLPLDDLICTDFSHDAYYHLPAEQAYELVVREKCENRTDTPIRNLAAIGDGYCEKLGKWKIEYKLLGTPSVQLDIQTISEGVPRTNNFGGNANTIYCYRASAEFTPPLPSGSGFDLVYRISASGVPIEVSAFSIDGTLFANGVEYNTLRYHITIHAPQGYKIVLREWSVVDADGKPMEHENARQKKPVLDISGGLLQWRITLAKKHWRYKLRYRFEAYGW
jgi:hypothetical protein